MLFYIGSGILGAIAIYCLRGMKKAYDKEQVLPLHVSVAIWILDTVHLLLVLLASVQGILALAFNKTIALMGGVVMAGVGIVIMLAGMIEFRSFRRMSGLDTSKIVTNGIYRYSRNPQYFGWFLMLLGISLMGRSGLAFILTIVLITGIHLYNIWLEEPYLKRIFGEEYLRYKSNTPGYIGILKKKQNGPHVA
ncbi:hypothetical protein ES703_106506 [subsurface metagenome]